MIALRYAVRSLGRSPGFTAIAIVTLGVGLGLATTMFGVMDAVVNPYTPYRDADKLQDVTVRLPRFTTLTHDEVLRSLRSRVAAFETVLPVNWALEPLEAGEKSREIGVARIPPGYFAMVGVAPRLGRVFTANDEPLVAVVSIELWRTLYGNRRSLAGATVTLGSRTHHIVGVLPRGANHPNGALVWLPLEPGWETRPFFPSARVKPLARVAGAIDQLRELAGDLSARYGSVAGPVSLNLAPVRKLGSQLRDVHFAMVGAAVVVLLIACVNLAHLMLARGFAKRRELAVRMAVGASRAAVVRQMFAECLLITLAGSALGAIVAVWGSDIIAARMPTDVAWVGMVKPQLSWRVFSMAASCAGVAAIVFGLVPALGIALDISLDEPLKDGAGTTGRQRQRYSPLVVFEVALALVLLMGGGLLLRTVAQLRRQQFGFDTSSLLTARMWISRCSIDSTLGICATRYGRNVVPVDLERVRQSVEVLEDVREAAYQFSAPPRGGLLTAEMAGGDSNRTVYMRYYPLVSPSYLRALGLPILNGRDFEPGDAALDGGVAIIDPIMADRLYPRQNPVGRMVKLGAPASDAPWVPIIGVARNPASLGDGETPPEPAIWVVRRLGLPPGWTTEIVLRAATGYTARASVETRRHLTERPGVNHVVVEPFALRRAAVFASRRFLTDVFVVMGAVALALAGLGLYGVLAYSVGQRMREFAIRVALGARSAQVVRMVVHDALVMLLAGTGIGAFVAMAAGKAVDSLLEGVFFTDAISLVGAEFLLIAVGVAAAIVPARRALRANPLDIMRAV